MTTLATVVITTKNRKGELRSAVHSAVSQSEPVEVLVMDDGSTDGTAEMVREQFPSARLEQSTTSVGCIVQRNRAAGLATGDIIFSLDDDAIFTSPHIVAHTLREFDHARVGAVAIPYIEPRKSAIVHQQAPSKDSIFVTDSFIGTAHALRKEIFLTLKGYREILVHQGEELDFCIRMLEAGYVVRLGSADPIHHLESPRRDFRRMEFYGRRNDILFALHNAPVVWLLPHLLGTTYLGLRHSLRMRRLGSHLQGLGSGWRISLTRRWERKPVKLGIYRLFRKLKKRGPLRLEDIEYRLPPLET